MGKVTRPVVTDILLRKRLFDLISRAKDRPVIWVMGPPGSGKTTLISSYIESRGLPCLWYQIDEGDKELATFFYYLGLSAKKAAPRKRKPLPLLTPEYLQDIPTFTFRYFEDLFNRLKVPAAIVFDNYHEVPEESPLHEVILNGVSRVPEGIKVIVISRKDPPPVFTRLRANHLMEGLGWEEVRLTLEESQGIIRLHAPQLRSKETIRCLHDVAGGWAAGLVLMLERVKREGPSRSLRAPGTRPQVLQKLSQEGIFDYFKSELFDRVDKEMQDFLLKTAFLPWMTVGSARELTGHPDAGRILSTLNRNNHFTEKRLQTEPVYQYHHLFREFLLTRARETFSRETLSPLLRRAAILLDETGQTEAAVRLFHESSEWDEIVPLIMKHAPGLLAQGRNRVLEEWLGLLPREVIEGNPWLLYWMGASRLPFGPSESRPIFERAFEGFKTRGDVAGIFLAWSGIMDSINYAFADLSPMDHWVSVLEGLMEEYRSFPSREIETQVASCMVAALALRQIQHRGVESWGERVLSLPEDHTTICTKIKTLLNLIYYRICAGDFKKIASDISLLRHLSRSPEATPLARVMAKFAEAFGYQFIGMPERCLEAVSRGLELSRTTGIRIFEHFLLAHGISSFLDANDYKRAGKWFKKMALSMPHFKPWDLTFYHLLKTREALIRGDVKEASLHADMSLKFGTEVGAPANEVLCHLEKAFVMHELGREREAAEHLGHCLRIAEQTKSIYVRFYALMAGAEFAFDRGEEESGLKSLREALAIGREGGYMNTFIDRPSVTAGLCVKAFEAGIEVGYVQELIRRRGLIPDKPPVHLEDWPWPLKIFTLGRFALIRDGKQVRFSRKTRQRPLSMLKVLIAFGGREVREDLIVDALWPEADGDAAHRSFVTTLQRLRRLIGDERVIQLREGRLTLDTRYCRVDAWAFERILGQAEARKREGVTDRARHLTEKAIGLYRGPFLAGETEQPYMTPIRERLRGKFLRGVGGLGRHYEEAGEWEKAIECYQRGLEVDDIAEELYQHLMICHWRLGQQAGALNAYHRCRRTLSAVLGIEPSAETEALKDEVLKGGC